VTTLAEVVSKRSELSNKQQDQLVREIFQSASGTSASPDALQKALLTIGQFSNNNFARAQNILFRGIKKAGVADPSEFIAPMGDVVPTAVELGDLSAGQATGVLAGALGRGKAPRQTGTAMKLIIQRLLGSRSSAGKDILPRIGVDFDQNLLEAMKQVFEARQAGRLSGREMSAIFGAEAGPFAQTLFSESVFPSFLAKVRAVGRAGRLDPKKVDLTGRQLRQLEQEQPRFELNRIESKAEATEKNIRSKSVRAQLVSAVRQVLNSLLQARVQKGIVTPDEKKAALAAFENNIGQGGDVQSALKAALFFSSSFDQAEGFFGKAASFADFSSTSPIFGEGVDQASQILKEVRGAFDAPEGQRLSADLFKGEGTQVNIENVAQKFEGTKDPDTGDLDAAVKGERPD